MLHIGAKSALAHHNRLLIFRMGAKCPDRRQFFGQRIDRPVDADGQNIIIFVQRTIDGPHFYIGSKTAQTGFNRFTRFRMNPNKPWQGEKTDGLLQRYFIALYPFGQRRPLGFGFFVFRVRFALLHI